jgi:hypothetical protein
MGTTLDVVKFHGGPQKLISIPDPKKPGAFFTYADDDRQQWSSTRDPLIIEAIHQGDEARAEADAARAEADTAYQPARAYYGEGKPFRDIHQLRQFLKKHPEVRSRPDPHHGRRRQVHHVDWCRYWQTVNPLEADDDLLERILAADADIQRSIRLEEARRRLLG